MRRFSRGSVSLSVLIAASTALGAPPQTTTLAVENMTCGTCPIVVKKALERVPGVTGFPSRVISKP
jgi:mercuric ion binding protein